MKRLSTGARVTHSDKRPDFFVVGAPKAATSSAYHYLGQHPDVFVPPMKEPHYFSYPGVADTYYDVPFITTEAEYLDLFEERGNESVAGDFSPSYLFHPVAAERIATFQPTAKIVVLLRDPVERAISHYLMDRRLGVQERPLSACLERTEANRLYYKEYVELGLYADQVATWLSTFERERVLILLYEDLADDPAAVVARLFRFLGVADDVPLDVRQAHNAHERRRWIARLLPKALRRRLRSYLYTTQKPAFRSERKALVETFELDVARLERLLERDLRNRWPAFA